MYMLSPKNLISEIYVARKVRPPNKWFEKRSLPSPVTFPLRCIIMNIKFDYSDFNNLKDSNPTQNQHLERHVKFFAAMFRVFHPHCHCVHDFLLCFEKKLKSQISKLLIHHCITWPGGFWQYCRQYTVFSPGFDPRPLYKKMQE